MEIYWTGSPLARTMDNTTGDFVNFNIVRATGMQGNTILQSDNVYQGIAYCPDGNEDVYFTHIVRGLLGTQLVSLTTLQGWYSPLMMFQNDFTLNTYITISDASTYTDYSLLYGNVNLNHTEANLTVSSGFIANDFPMNEYIYNGQYFSMLYRRASNIGQGVNDLPISVKYWYHTGIVQAEGSMELFYPKRQSYLIAGILDTYSFDPDHDLDYMQFGQVEPKTQEWMPLTPKWKVKYCIPDNTAVLYYVNSKGATDWLYSTQAFSETKNITRNNYEKFATIEYRRNFGENAYFSQAYSTYSFPTEIVADEFSETFADVLHSNYTWIWIPSGQPDLRSVLITDSNLKVKKRANNGRKAYNYTYSLKDSIKRDML